MIKTTLNISLDHPLVRNSMSFPIFCFHTRSHRHADMLQSSMAASARSKSIRDMPKFSFEDRLQNLFCRALNNAVLIVGMSRGRNSPGLPGFGIIFLREGLGQYFPMRSSSLISSRKVVTPGFRQILATVLPSTPGVRLPLFLATVDQAHRRFRRSVTQFHKSRYVPTEFS